MVLSLWFCCTECMQSPAMHAARQTLYLDKEARQTCMMYAIGTWSQEMSPPDDAAVYAHAHALPKARRPKWTLW